MSDYVRVGERFLALEESLQWIEDYVRGVDAALRLRKSLDYPGFYVLERRRTRTPTTYEESLTFKDGTTVEIGLCDGKVTARDGYVHVSHVHPALMTNPLELVTRLRANYNDLGASGNSAAQWWDRYVRAERDAKEARSRQREDEFRGRAREAFDIMDRVGNPGGHNERMRIAAPGPEYRLNITHDPSTRTPSNEEARARLVAHWQTALSTEDCADLSPTFTEETSVGELSNVESPQSAGTAEDGSLHDHPPA